MFDMEMNSNSKVSSKNLTYYILFCVFFFFVIVIKKRVMRRRIIILFVERRSLSKLIFTGLTLFVRFFILFSTFELSFHSKFKFQINLFGFLRNQTN